MCANYRKLVAIAVLSAVLGAAHAEDAKVQARDAAVADGVTSAAGLVAGVPVNPLLPIAGMAFKAATWQRAEKLPDTERPKAYALAAASWQGSAAGNACAVVSVVSGGSFLPACILVGVAWGWKTWNASERERRDADRCAALRAARRKPKLRCPFMRSYPERTVARARPARHPRSFVAAQDLVAP